MISPLEYNILIRQEKAQEKTSGGLWKPQETVEREKHGTTRGEIVAVSPMAFSFDDWPAGHEKPKAGDRIAFAQHAGVFIKDDDGTEIRLIKDRDVLAVFEPAAPAGKFVKGGFVVARFDERGEQMDVSA